MQQQAYRRLKQRVHAVAELSAGCGDIEARARGYLDVFDLLMKDHDGTCQPKFLAMLPLELADGDARRALLDGMALEYAALPGWMGYIQSEHWRR